MKQWTLLFALIACTLTGFAQEELEVPENRGFKKENLFTGGSLSLGFGNRSFTAGISPVFGYKIADWIDAGLVGNYQYTSYRHYFVANDKLRQTNYGGGVFTRLYPINFLFAQAQFEHNFIKQKYIPVNGANPTTANYDASSFLIGGGYTTNRYPESGQPFFYVAVLFDVLNQENSPYTDAYGRTIPILRAGVQVPLFQGRGNRY